MRASWSVSGLWSRPTATVKRDIDVVKKLTHRPQLLLAQADEGDRISKGRMGHFESKPCKTLEASVKEGRMRALILGAALAAAATPALAEFRVSSTNVKSGSPMALAQVLGSCNGQNISPALTWSGEPADTQSFVLTMVDTDAQNGRGWWHWSVFNIPASVHRLAAGAGSEGSKDLPAGAIQGRTDFGFSHYGGPCPPIGDHAHHYEITIYALKVPSLPLDETASGAQVGSSLGANTLATAKIVGRYGRSK
jgi:Raf kinase inhibitor-like YbhB/YbcL family protein